MRVKISEKSLEMNVNENLVNSIRRWGGLFAKTFIYGFTLREEAYHGFDSSIKLSQHSPYFLDRTCFINIRDFPSHTFDGNVHIIEIESQNYSGSVFSSDKADIKVYRGKEFLRKMKEVKPITVEKIRMKKLRWEYVYEKLEDIGIKRHMIDAIREKEGKLRHKFTSGFFTR